MPTPTKRALMSWLKNNLNRLLLIAVLAVAAFFGVQKLRGPLVDVAAVQEGPIEQSIVVSGRVQADRKSTRLNSSHSQQSRMPSSA